MPTDSLPVDTTGDGFPDLTAIPVAVVDTVTEETSPSELASLNSYPNPGVNFAGTEAPFQILPQDKRRHRAVIQCFGTAANGIVLGKQGQASNNKGFYLVAGGQLVYESSAALWAFPQAANGAVGISVLDERYMPRNHYNTARGQ